MSVRRLVQVVKENRSFGEESCIEDDSTAVDEEDDPVSSVPQDRLSPLSKGRASPVSGRQERSGSIDRRSITPPVIDGVSVRTAFRGMGRSVQRSEDDICQNTREGSDALSNSQFMLQTAARTEIDNRPATNNLAAGRQFRPLSAGPADPSYIRLRGTTARTNEPTAQNISIPVCSSPEPCKSLL